MVRFSIPSTEPNIMNILFNNAIRATKAISIPPIVTASFMPSVAPDAAAIIKFV